MLRGAGDDHVRIALRPVIEAEMIALSVTVALGALHLYGERGVLALLGQDGYRTRRIY